MRRVLSAACLLLAALPAAAVDEASTVTNIQVKRESENWPSVILSPSLGFGLPHSVAVSGRVETNGLVPFLVAPAPAPDAAAETPTVEPAPAPLPASDGVPPTGPDASTPHAAATSPTAP